MYRHLEALWFANVANSILWWAFVKVRCSLAMLFTAPGIKLLGLPGAMFHAADSMRYTGGACCQSQA